ncbi:(2Fe-2S)-binding protein [Jiella pacifica]|uniref:2Fe-2S iron-sulfur cluster binding domain-containing protein n=1 Tax=Jiella pacifica TaxID=2696469 RepID=A0A6N9SZ63_9HYPH|nr:(2Fe-2S)-binding protein [Jiella pacifica]NDW03215.1 2Fe-2S iron-sulfur cluster binding domain-containing protein [Jiella pacifica]
MTDSFQSRIDLEMTINGEAVELTVPAGRHLIDVLRHDLGLTGSHVGCEHGVCGACTILVDDSTVRGCLTLAAQLQGCEVWTIEGLTEKGVIADLQKAFVERNALQCGYCTPGMLASAKALVEAEGVPSRETIREHMSGNYCRCTGYEAIVDAIETVARQRADETGARSRAGETVAKARAGARS